MKILLFIFSLFSFTAASGYELSQLFKISSSYFSTNENSVLTPDQNSLSLNDLNYRLLLDHNTGPYSFKLHYQLHAQHRNTAIISTSADDTGWFDLSDVISENSSTTVEHRLDRFSFSYNTTNSSTTLGRQAITWGNGLVFNVMDLFNPFSPTAIDKEYKPGEDMLYFQAVTNSGNNWELLLIPRRDINRKISFDNSSVSVKRHWLAGDTDLNLLIAEHYRDEILGLGISHAIGDSLWRLDMTRTWLPSGESVSSMTTNIDYSWNAMQTNFYGFIEYFHNGFGLDDNNQPAESYLSTRLERGELFNLLRNYLAAGLRVELHPLLNLSPTLIMNLDDSSRLLSITLQYDALQNMIISAQLVTSAGNDNSEYNGPTYSGDSLSLMLSYYF